MMVTVNTSMHKIVYLFESIHLMRHRLMNELTAKDLRTFCYTISCQLTDEERRMYLQPLRDLVEQEDWTRTEVGKGTKISIVSTHLPVWMMRVRRPEEYWKTFKDHITIKIWILAKVSDEERDDINYHVLHRMCDRMDHLLHDDDAWMTFSAHGISTNDGRFYNAAPGADEYNSLITKCEELSERANTLLKTPGTFADIIVDSLHDAHLLEQGLTTHYGRTYMKWYASNVERSSGLEIV